MPKVITLVNHKESWFSMFNIVKKLIIILFLFNHSLGSNSIKITLVERISQFIEWPQLNEKFVIGIYQNEQLKDEMISTYEEKTIQKLPIEVYNIKDEKDERIQKVNLLYFTKELSTETEKILKEIKNFPVLIITEFPNDVYEGMHLGLYYENQRIKFIINQKALESAQLKASYKILKLAKIVKTEK